ncbi:MAG: peptide ABC transporter [Streptosporangiales bacterium]|nr:peptide ABC transporter [Streptosporangiales bacterium]
MARSNPVTRRSYLRWAAVATAAGLALTGCSLSSDSGDEGDDGSKQSLTVDIPNYPASLDPGLQYDSASYTVYRNVFDQLLRRDPKTQKVVPWVADSWKRVDATTWTFKIHDGIEFSNGEELTADDAAFSINRILKKSLNSPQFANFSAISKATAKGDELTVETHEPSPTLLSYLTTLSVVPEDYVTKVGDEKFNTEPVGSGAFQITSTTSGSTVEMKANTKYWKDEPDVKKVTFRAVPNVATRVADLKSGRADIVTQLTPDDAVDLKGGGQANVLSVPTERISYLALNTAGDAPTKDVKVRQAVAHAINYPSIIKNLQHGYAKQVKSVVTPLAFGYPKDVSGYDYDPAKAKRLLKEAGSGSRTLVFPTSPSYDPQLTQAIQADLQKVGFKVKLVNSDQATFLKKVQSPKHDWGSLRFGRWSCSCLDADGVIYPLFRSDTVWSSYSNPQFDKAVDAARSTTDTAKRETEYGKAFGIMQRDVPGIGLYQDYAIYGTAKNISWKPDAQENFFVTDVEFNG